VAEDIGGVYICTPDTAHKDNAIEALTYGVPVLCEKPMGLNREEALAMLEADRAASSWLQLGFEYRFSKAFWRVHEIIESRELGAPLNVYSEYCSGPYLPNTYRLDPSRNPGLFNEKLCHMVDLFRFWLEDEITEVQAYTGLNALPWYTEIPDNVIGLYRFSRGGLGLLIHNHSVASAPIGLGGLVNVLSNIAGADVSPFSQAGHNQRSVVICESGALICDIWEKTLVVNERQGENEMQVKRIENFSADMMMDLSHDMHGEVLDFIHRFQEGLPARQTAEDAYRSSIATHASEEALRSGRAVRLEW
jgi:predicted dehydrogenase